ncbi:hypothetical protein [Leucobacter weissii]|uniref:hypothetical protein n=1 Tax=Leucobacter weissii TaxID=1983706 RepID=UPI001FB71CFF|nr:hypothetical protein [Leucobacter weissii]
MDVQTRDVSGFGILPLQRRRFVDQRIGVERRVEQCIERFPVIRSHRVDVLDLVDVDPLEERLVADAPERVVQAHVDRVSIPRQSQAVLQLILGLVVLNLTCIDP